MIPEHQNVPGLVCSSPTAEAGGEGSVHPGSGDWTSAFALPPTDRIRERSILQNEPIGPVHVQRVLLGTDPRDLPIEQVDKLEALGLKVPQSMLLRVDEAIE